MITAVKNSYNTAFKAGNTQNTQTAQPEQSGSNLAPDSSLAEKPKQTQVQTPVYDKNPIKKSGERATALLATMSLGIVAGLRLLCMILDDGDGEGAKFLGEMSQKVANKILMRNTKPGEKLTLMNKIFAPVAVIAGFVALFAVGYTLYNLPKTMYNADVKTFKKKKDMDVYIKGNAVEQELYNQMNEKAKSATAEEKAKLNQQYAKLKAAKNVVPDFVKLKQPELKAQQK